MSLLSRLVSPAVGEVKLPVHAFMAALAELKRGSPSLTVAEVVTAFQLSPSEETELNALVASQFVDGIERSLVHDVLMLGEEDIYTLAEVQGRLVDNPAPVNLFPLVTHRAFQVMARGLNGNCVLSGCAVAAQGTPDMTLAVSKGAVLTGGVVKPVTAGNVTISAAHATLPRIDLVVVDSTGAKAVRVGTPASSPAPGALQADDVCLAFVHVPPADTAIQAAQILDTRVFNGTGAVTLGKLTTPIVRNNTAVAQTFLNFTVPSGLFSAGKIIRVSMGGTMLLNSGTPTITLRIAFGGTTLFQDVTGTATADVDRLAWNLSFNLVAQADNDQTLNGTIAFTPLGAKTAPNTGTGDISGAAALVNPFNGASAVDVTTADRTLTVEFTMSVANAANEIVQEYATGELI